MGQRTSTKEKPRSPAPEAAQPNVPATPLRVVVGTVEPQVDGGRYPIKRSSGERVVVEADVFTDGHDEVACDLLFRKSGDTSWNRTAMQSLGNDRWQAAFEVDALGRWTYTVQARLDPFLTWQRDLRKRLKAGDDVQVDLLVGAQILERVADRAALPDGKRLAEWARKLHQTSDPDSRLQLAQDAEVADVAGRYPPPEATATYSPELEVWVEREKARFSTWYELFPRSCSGTPDRHGTFADVEKWLPRIDEMGFDVLYLPPIHPIGRKHRKGPNNVLVASPTDVGSPWAIGAREGGHTAIHPQLGTLDDFRRLVKRASDHKIEIALDVAYQCSPDHPWVQEHPQWFRHRPDGTVQYAENPPKKYQDIYPFDFESSDAAGLWSALRDVVRFWNDQGVRIFRVDNPHTKPFRFWEWLIDDIRSRDPNVLFLSEAFTRPRVMQHLAKIGFSQSYTYFAWRNTKPELEAYLMELTRTSVSEYLRPNFWPNTPDILTEYLQFGGRPAFMSRLVLAATLTASYGIYGPAYEACIAEPREPGSEEYLNSEKYEIRSWNLDAPGTLGKFIARVNRIRHEHPALQQDRTLQFHAIDNEQILCYTKTTDDGKDIVLTTVNLDPHHVQTGWVQLSLDSLGLDSSLPFQVHDLVTDARYIWQGPRNFVELRPSEVPAHIFAVRRRVRSEHDFEYYL